MRIYMRVMVMTIGLFLATSLVIQAQPSPAPRVWSITLNDNATTTQRTTFIVTFSEAVSGVDTSDFRVFSSGKTAIVSVNPGRTDITYIIEISRETTDEIALALFDDDTIINSAGIPLGGIGAQNGNAISHAAGAPPPSADVAVQDSPSTRNSVERKSPRTIDDLGRYAAVALTSANIPVISYYDETFKDLKLAVCTDAICSNPTISTIDSAFFVGEYVSLKLTSANIPVMSYFDSTKDDLKLAICNNTACTSPTIKTIDSTGSVGEYTSLALTSDDIPVISYLDVTNSALKLAMCDNANCTSSSTQFIDNSDDVGMYTSLALPSSDIPVISYYDYTNSALKLAVCNNATCTSPIIRTKDSTGNVGAYSSVALTSDNVPVISYRDSVNGNLKLAVCNDAACTSPSISVLDATGNVGIATSIALTSNNIPVITYLDYSGYTLKLVECTNAACTYHYILSVASTDDEWGLYNTSMALTSDNVPVVSYFAYGTGLKLFHGPVIVDQGQPNSFTKSAPAIGERITTTTATLEWAASTHAASYEYCYATSIAACTTWVNTGTTRTATITGLAHDTTYYWQVRAVNPSGTRAANGGTMYTFRVTLPPAAFAKSAPANNDVNRPTRQTLTWEASTRATSYEYCIALTTAACTNWITTGAVRSVTVSSLANNKAYYWQVRAKNAAGTVLASGGFWKFTTIR